MHFTIAGINVEVQKKKIKNMHLSIKPPDGHVVISSPEHIPDKAIEMFARTNLGYIKDAIQKFQAQPRLTKRQYVSGESLYVWGRQYYLVFTPGSKRSLTLQGDKAILTMPRESSVKQRESFVRECYRSWLKKEIEKRLPQWEDAMGIVCTGWQTKNMITKWGVCNTDKGKLWFNLQLAQKPIECLDFVIVHELTHLRERRHNAVFVAYMDKYLPHWRELRRKLNDSKLDYYEAQDETPLQKLVNKKRFEVIKEAAIKYLYERENILAGAAIDDVTIENVIHIYQPHDGIITFDVLVCCDVNMSPSSSKGNFIERWVSVSCKVTCGIELSDFIVTGAGPCFPEEESDNERLSGEFVPIIKRQDFDKEAEKFLERYYPQALKEPMAVPIDEIAEKMKLCVVEALPLADELKYYGMIVFEDGSAKDNKTRKLLVKQAKRGTIYLDPRVKYERTESTRRNTLAHECFHWYRHQPYHALMRMIGAADDRDIALQYHLIENHTQQDKWKPADWMEWQANGIAPRILMPAKTVRMAADQLLQKYGYEVLYDFMGNEVVQPADITENELYEQVIDELTSIFDVSREMARLRLMELGYKESQGAYPKVDGQSIPSYTFNAEMIEPNQSFDVSMKDVIKAVYFDHKFRELVSTGQFLFIDGHICLNLPQYVELDISGYPKLTAYALQHLDECCLVFDVGFTYDTAYNVTDAAGRQMFKATAGKSAIEKTYAKDSPQNRNIIEQLRRGGEGADKMKKLPGSFGGSLKMIMKEKGINNAQLALAVNVSEKTIQRLRHESDDYASTKQVIVGICYVLNLPGNVAVDLVNKSQHGLNKSRVDSIYFTLLTVGGSKHDLYEANEMLASVDCPPLGGDDSEIALKE